MKNWILVILIISSLVLVIEVSGCVQESSTNTTSSNTKEMTTVQATWHYIVGFSGPPDKIYYAFKIKGDKFRITSTGNPYQGDYSLLTLYVFAPGTNSTLYFIPQNNTQIKLNPDTSVDYAVGNKTFHLTREEYVAVIQSQGVLSGTGNLTPQVKELLQLKAVATLRKLIEEQLSNGILIQEIILEENVSQGRANYSEFFVLGSRTETSISYAGPGEYYLVVGTNNIYNWNVQIEDYY